MKSALEAIRARALERLQNAEDLAALEEARVQLLGKKGELTAILKQMGSLSAEERPVIGQLANEVRGKIESAVSEKMADIKAAAADKKLASETIDVTLPGKRHELGKRHPLNSVLDEIKEIFLGMGFDIAEGPEVEYDYYNFEALNIPKDHPARDTQDTFYINDKILLRTQTSGVQIHTMESQKPPIYMICPGTVYRPDTADACHLPQFNQIEGLVVDEGITFGDLKGTLDYFVKCMFGEDRKTRYRPHFFPFTEPSCEVDVSCHVCGGKGCNFCKHSGWIEILGCGMVDPNVLINCGIDPEKYTGFAFGIGAERVAALRYDLPDLRTLMTGDMRFLNQF